MTNSTSFGISAFGYSFGEKQNVEETACNFVSDPERVFKWDCQTYYRSPPDRFALDLATDAAREAISKANIDPNSIDLVAFASAEIAEYLYWDSSVALARALGIERTQTMLLNNEGCSAGIRIFGAIAGVFATQPEIQTVLVVIVNRVSEYHRNRMKVVNCILSDGAVTAVLQRGHPHNQYLASDHFVYPEFCDFFRMDYGGTKAPITPAGWTCHDEHGYDKIYEHFGDDIERMQNFLTVQRNERLAEVVQRSCARANISKDDISHFFYVADSRPGAIAEIVKPFGIPIENTNLELARMYGHMGAADQFFSLGKFIESRHMGPGDIAAMAGISSGIQWCSTLFRV